MFILPALSTRSGHLCNGDRARHVVLGEAARVSGLLLAVVGVLALTACHPDESPTAVPVSDAVLAPDVAGMPDTIATVMDYVGRLDKERTALAIEHRAFGGSFVEDETTVVWTTDLSEAARVGLVDGLRAHGMISDAAREGAGVQFRPADYSWLQLEYWRAITAQTRSPNIRILDADDRANRLFVGVETPEAIAPARDGITGLGVPAAAVTFGTVTLMVDDSDVQDATVTPRAGYQIQNGTNYGICSMGGNGLTRSTGLYFFFTASHCSNTIGQLDAFDSQYQALVSDVLVGWEWDDEPWYTNASSPWYDTCPGGYNRCKMADVSVYVYDDPYSTHNVDLRVARPLLNSIVLDNPASWSQNGLKSGHLSVGSAVTLLASQSGRREGQVTSSCFDINWTVQNGYYRCMEAASYFSQGGDSGGGVVRTQGSGKMIVGVHKGRYSQGGVSYAIYTPAQNIRFALLSSVGTMNFCESLTC